MPRTRPGALAIAGALALTAWAGSTPARAEGPQAEPRQQVARRSESRRSPGESPSTGGWWLGTAGIAAALAVAGGASLASRRFLPARDLGPIQVVGRAALSPRQSVFLVRVGDRVLILGAGAQGPPSALGEVTDPGELARLAPRRPARPEAPRPGPAFDRRIGGDE